MKIAVITDYNDKTGIGLQNYNLFIGLRRLGIDIDIINLVSSQGFKENPKYGINIISSILNNKYLSFGYGVLFKFPRSLKKLLLFEKKYDKIILGHQGLAYLYKPLSRLHQKLMIIIHDLFPLYEGTYSGFDYFIYKHFLLSHLADFTNMIFISDFTKKDYASYYGNLDKKNHKTIYQGIENMKISEEIEKNLIDKLNLRGKYIILNVGSEDKRKNMQTFLEIANHYKHNKDISFIRIGKKSRESDIYIMENELDNIIYLSGLSKEEIIAFYKTSKIVISTSFLEGYGRQIFEGYLYDNFIITTKVSDIELIFKNDKNVFIINHPKNIQEYIGYIDNIYQKKMIFHRNIKIQSIDHEVNEYLEFMRNMR